MLETRIYIPNKVEDIFEKIATILDCIKETNLDYFPNEVIYDKESINFNLVSKVDQKSANISILKSKESTNKDYFGLGVLTKNENIPGNIVQKKVDILFGFIESCRSLTTEQIKQKYYSTIKGISRQTRWISIVAFVILKFYYFFSTKIDDFKSDYEYNNVYTSEGYSIAFDSFIQNWFIHFGIQIVILYFILKFIIPRFKPKGNPIW